MSKCVSDVSTIGKCTISKTSSCLLSENVRFGVLPKLPLVQTVVPVYCTQYTDEETFVTLFPTINQENKSFISYFSSNQLQHFINTVLYDIHTGFLLVEKKIRDFYGINLTTQLHYTSAIKRPQ